MYCIKRPALSLLRRVSFKATILEPGIRYLMEDGTDMTTSHCVRFDHCKCTITHFFN